MHCAVLFQQVDGLLKQINSLFVLELVDAVQLSSSPFLKTLVFTTSEHALFVSGNAQWLISKSDLHSPPQSKPISGCDMWFLQKNVSLCQVNVKQSCKTEIDVIPKGLDFDCDLSSQTCHEGTYIMLLKSVKSWVKTTSDVLVFSQPFLGN